MKDIIKHTQESMAVSMYTRRTVQRNTHIVSILLINSTDGIIGYHDLKC